MCVLSALLNSTPRNTQRGSPARKYRPRPGIVNERVFDRTAVSVEIELHRLARRAAGRAGVELLGRARAHVVRVRDHRRRRKDRNAGPMGVIEQMLQLKSGAEFALEHRTVVSAVSCGRRDHGEACAILMLPNNRRVVLRGGQKRAPLAMSSSPISSFQERSAEMKRVPTAYAEEDENTHRGRYREIGSWTRFRRDEFDLTAAASYAPNTLQIKPAHA